MKDLQEKIEALTYDEYSQSDKTTPSEFVFSEFEKLVDDDEDVPQSVFDAMSEKEAELEAISESLVVWYKDYYEEYGVSEKDFH